MSSLILITGTIDQAEDPFHRLDFNQLYYETWKDDIDTKEIWKETERVPIKFYNSDIFRLVQQKGSGKTLKAMDILSQKAFYGGNVAANLGLIWHNQVKKDKREWDACINTVDDFMNLKHCTALIDDVALWIKKWNTSQATILAEISAAGRKSGLDMICTSQRENQIPPEIRDQATEWIVPIIRVRDERTGSLNPDDNTGRPIELVTLHFDGAKVFKYMSDPIINLEPLMACYSTVEKSINLADNKSSARPNQPGYVLEAKAYEFLNKTCPAMQYKHLDGKNVFDIISDTHAIDVVGSDPDGALVLEHKDLIKHILTAKRKCQKPYIMFMYAGNWRFVPITQNLNELVMGKRINPAHLAQRLKTIDSI
ncbi:MAG: hypothetical protein PHQ22_10530 [Sulfuricurvum sp.]|nr:hypothetical protein [Sulfuricurvum sp.]